MRKFLTVAMLTATAALGAVSVAGTANAGSATATADPSVGIIKQATTSYQQPTNTSKPVHWGLDPNEAVHVRCFTEGQKLSNNNYWVQVGKNNYLGFVHSSAIHTPQGTPHC